MAKKIKNKVLEADLEQVPEPEVIQPPPEPARRMGRPQVAFDEKLIENMLRGGSSGVDIAEAYGCDRGTLYRWVERTKGISFDTWSRQCKAASRHLLRVTQLKVAMGYSDEKTEVEFQVDAKTGKKTEVKRKTTVLHHPPNAAMLIFLGKNNLGQSDMPEPADGAGKFGQIPDYRMVGDEEEGEEKPALGAGHDDDFANDPSGNYADRFNDDDDEEYPEDE
ncbi:hypothetical protein [Spirosoma sordidisoli]|uniref:Helix-turn-helix domain-containing protein n=1 Tax=Spirosoma sordidisoli TaxID=2502893 RepID=A0A4Q2UC39_9BACT|nr:hypothetical protein [Spirosoma sordidisoli]RYC66364.1 hypothetical protein EQG79_30285 [Spirosoma sordidisoli]